MKTPREILLARHKTVEPKLDGIRRSVVAEFNAKTQRSEGAKIHAAQVDESLGVFASLRLCVEKLFRELIWPCRRTWAGLAAAWLAILVFNHSQSESTPVASAQLHTPPAEIRLALREQHRVLEEILGIRAPAISVERVRRPNNQPRTERRSALTA